MSKKLSGLFVGVFAAVAFAAGIVQGCGSSSSSNNNVALCEKVCDKALECVPDAGAIGQQALTECKQRCQSAGATKCTNESAIVNAANACLAKTCDEFLTCSVPDCQTASGTGGSGGSGGSTGTGGAGGSGGGSCSVCTKADACCSALAGGQACNLVTSCNAATGTQQTQAIMACQAVLDAVAGNPQAPAACQ